MTDQVRKFKTIPMPLPPKQFYNSFEELYKDYYDILVKRFDRHSGDYYDGEDIAQDVMLQIFTYWDRIIWTSFGGLVGRMAHNTTLAYQMKYDKKVDKDKYEDLLIPDRHDNGESDPEKYCMGNEVFNKTSEILSQLKPVDQEMYLDRYFRDVSPKEIMKKYGITNNAMQVRYFRINTQVRNFLIDLGIKPTEGL